MSDTEIARLRAENETLRQRLDAVAQDIRDQAAKLCESNAESIERGTDPYDRTQAADSYRFTAQVIRSLGVRHAAMFGDPVAGGGA